MGRLVYVREVRSKPLSVLSYPLTRPSSDRIVKPSLASTANPMPALPSPLLVEEALAMEAHTVGLRVVLEVWVSVVLVLVVDARSTSPT